MRKIKNPILVATTLILIGISAFVGHTLSYRGLILPNISVSGVDISGLPPGAAEQKIKLEFEKESDIVLLTDFKNEEVEKVEISGLKRDYKWVSEQAYKIGRSGNVTNDAKNRVEALFVKKELNIPLVYNEDDLNDTVESLADKVDDPPVWPRLVLIDEVYVFEKGLSGQVMDKEETKKKIRESLSLPIKHIVQIPSKTINTNEDLNLVNKALERLNSWGSEPLLIKYKEFNKELKKEEVALLYGLNGNIVNTEKLNVLLKEISDQIETEPKDAVFEFENGRVNEFKQEVLGVKVDVPKFEQKLGEILTVSNERSFDIPVILNYPKIRTGDINNLGIKELIAVGKSSFDHSIPGRVFNVNLASSRINGVVVAPGEEFSFNKAVGEISRQTGYQTAYVISEGKTVLGDGGGVCQVSTTVFRAAMNFGFPITERRSHAYRVGYYEQDSFPGLDATIYSPSTDFKFLNDTGHHILVQTKVDTKNYKMQVEIYGTSDGRKSTVSKPVISSQSSAPPASYIDDPNLKKGITKQIDWAASGAKVSFSYKVEKDGATHFEKNFISNYQPWRAVYLVGTGE